MARNVSGSKNEPIFSSAGALASASDLSEDAAYAAFVGNRKVGPTTGTATAVGSSNTGRTTSTGADVWEGLEWFDTTDHNAYVYESGGWVALFAKLIAISSGGGIGTPGVPKVKVAQLTVTPTGAGAFTVNFDTAFPSKCVVVVPIPMGNAVGPLFLTSAPTASGFAGTAANQGTVAFVMGYIAVGF